MHSLYCPNNYFMTHLSLLYLEPRRGRTRCFAFPSCYCCCLSYIPLPSLLIYVLLFLSLWSWLFRFPPFPFQMAFASPPISSISFFLLYFLLWFLIFLSTSHFFLPLFPPTCRSLFPFSLSFAPSPLFLFPSPFHIPWTWLMAAEQNKAECMRNTWSSWFAFSSSLSSPLLSSRNF